MAEDGGGGALRTHPADDDLRRPVAVRSVERTLARRYSTYINEVQRLIEAARDVMEREQTLSPRVSDIVAQAGLSNQAFYRHFRSKNELMLAILDDGSRQMAAYVESQMATKRSGVAKIRAWIEGSLVQTVVERTASVSRGVILNTLELRAEFLEESDRTADLVRRPLIEAIAQAQAEGEVETDDPQAAAEMVFRLTMSLMELWLLRRRSPTKAEIERLVGFVLHGLGAR